MKLLLIITWKKNNGRDGLLEEVCVEKGAECWNLHVKAEIGFCLGKLYRRRCRGKVRRETGKLGETSFLGCVWHWKESKQLAQELPWREKKGTCVLSGAGRWKEEKEGFEVTGKQ